MTKVTYHMTVESNIIYINIGDEYMNFLSIMDIIILMLPLIMVQIGLVIYCVSKIFNEGVDNLTKWSWVFICIFISLIGPISFLIIGRNKAYR